MSWIQLRFHRALSPQAGPSQVAYVVTASIDSAYGIPAELFVVATFDDSYEHAAEVYDLLNFPSTKGLAQNPLDPSPYYRVSSVTQTFDRPAGVDAFIAYVQTTLTATNQYWSAQEADTFGGDEVVILNASLS